MDLKQIGATGYSAVGAPSALFVFAHGAGAGQHHPFMAGVARAVAAHGIDVVTFDFPYKRLQKSAPDRPPVLEQSFREAVDAAGRWSRASRLFIGGKSMGGRIATHLAAQGLRGWLEWSVSAIRSIHPANPINCVSRTSPRLRHRYWLSRANATRSVHLRSFGRTWTR